MMQNTCVDRLLRVLFDSGSDKTMLKRSALPNGLNPSKGRKLKITGVTSSAVIDQEVTIDNMTLPEFLSTRRVSGPIRAIIMDHNDAPYDLIIGMDLMQTLGIDIHNTSKTVVWDDMHIPFKPRDYFTNNLFTNNLRDAMANCMNDADPLDLGYKSKNIRSSLYTENDPNEVAQQQKHLTPSQRQDLASFFSKFPKLFSGKLADTHIDFDDNNN